MYGYVIIAVGFFFPQLMGGIPWLFPKITLTLFKSPLFFQKKIPWVSQILMVNYYSYYSPWWFFHPNCTPWSWSRWSRFTGFPQGSSWNFTPSSSVSARAPVAKWWTGRPRALMLGILSGSIRYISDIYQVYIIKPKIHSGKFQKHVEIYHVDWCH